jgi:hypothetical protein
MWRWDQGRIEYFQFDEIRKLAKYAVGHDLAEASHTDLSAATGLPFYPKSDAYPPWRNYSRVFRAAMLVAQIGRRAVPTKVARLLSVDGQITSDEYFHFLAQVITDPAPAFREWAASDRPRFPLLFTLKFLLAKAALGAEATPYPTIVGAYVHSGFVGDEDQTAFLAAAGKDWPPVENRQARESIQILSQISYLSASSRDVSVSLDASDALEIFESLDPVRGDQASNREAEILRLGDLYEGAVAGLELDYSKTVLDQTVEAGFAEGNRVERTHVVLERNQAVRLAYFSSNPTCSCDMCGRDTSKEYPWLDRVLDIHHVLPLCSGTRSTKDGTVLTDLVALCPTCHRAVHRYYATWLKAKKMKDFADAKVARLVYEEAKSSRKTL